MKRGSALDEPGWLPPLTFRCYGLRIGLRAASADLARAVAEYLPPGARVAPLSAVDRLYSIRERSGQAEVVADDEAPLAAGDRDLALAALDANLRLYIAAEAHRRVFVHAGVVGWKGRAIVIPGRTFTGKSTLVKALVDAGARYYSDEYAVLDARGRVHPFAKPISLREPGSRRGRRQPIEELGGRIGKRPLPVGLVVVTRYEEGATWRPAAITRGQAVLALVDNAVAARHAAERVWPSLRAAVTSANAVQSARGAAESAVASLLALALS